MPRPKGKMVKKAASIAEAGKGSEVSDAASVDANGLKEVEVGDVLIKSDASAVDAIVLEEEDDVVVKGTSGRGGGRGKKAPAVAAKGRGRAKKTEDIEVIAQDLEENAQSNGGVESSSVEEKQQEEVVTKAKTVGGKGKRGAKAAAAAAAAKESVGENGETKENGDADDVEEVKEVAASKTSRGRGGRKAIKEDAKETEMDENNPKAQEPEIKATVKKAAGRKKKSDEKTNEGAIEKEVSAGAAIDPTKEENKTPKEGDNISEQEAVGTEEPEEKKTTAKKTGGRKKKNDKESTEAAADKEINGKSLFDLLKEETGAEKDKEENPNELNAVEEDATKVDEAETKIAPKKAGGRKKKADGKPAAEVVIENEINGTTDTDVKKEDDVEQLPMKKGRAGGRKATAVNNKAEETNANEEESVANKKITKRGAKVVETPKGDDVVEVENKPTKRGRGGAAKTPAAAAEEVTEIGAANEAGPKKRSRKENNAGKEPKPEVEKSKRGGYRGGKRKAADKLEEEAVAVVDIDANKAEAPPSAEVTEDATVAIKTEKPATASTSTTTTTTTTITTGRGGRKRAAPSSAANNVKTETAAAATETPGAAATPITADDDPAAAAGDEDDEAADTKSSKAKKKKKDTPTDGGGGSKVPMNATATKYNKEDFQLPPLAEGQTADEPRYNLKISTWNVAGLRAWLKKDGLKFLDYEEPDIFCLQETKCANDQLPEEVARIPGYHPYWLCMPGGYAGVAIYSKIMPIHVEYGIGQKEFDDVGRVITAEYEKFFLINVYVPNSGRKLVNLEARMKWEKLFQEFVQKYNERKPVVICGDMNVSHLEIDLANPKTNTRNAGFTKEERDKMTELLALGYVDTFRHLYPERKGAYTFWTYMGNARSRNVGWRLDYFIVSERFVQKVVDNCIRSQCMGSDHCPSTLFLKL